MCEIRVKYLVVVLFMLLVAGAGQSLADSQDRDSRQARLNDIAERWARVNNVPGVVIRVEDGGEPYVAASGVEHLGLDEAMKGDSSFRTASVAKLFTAAAVLRLVEQGRLKLDHSMGRYIPECLLNRLNNYDGVNYGPKITIRQLLQHTSGLPNTDDDSAKGAWLDDYMERQRTPEELLTFAILQRAVGAPGEQQEYSSAGYTALGMIIESVAHPQPYHDVIRELVRKPADMEQTYEEQHELPESLVPSSYYEGEQDMTEYHPSLEFADGGFVSTTRDLIRFGHALQQGRIVKDSALLKQMLTPFEGRDHAFGLGPWVDRKRSYFVHGGYWGTCLYVEADGFAVAFAYNQSDVGDDHLQVSRDLKQIPPVTQKDSAWEYLLHVIVKAFGRECRME